MKKVLAWKVMLAAALVGVLAAAVVVPAAALDARAGDSIHIAAGEVVEDDLYATAGFITVDGTIIGDLVASAGMITINGTVEGDVIANTNRLQVNGTVGGDLMVWAQEVVIRGTVLGDVRSGVIVFTLAEGGLVADDLAVGMASLEIQPGSTVQGNLMAAGGQVLMEGHIAEDMMVAAGALELNGSVGGDVKADVGEVEDRMTFEWLFFIPDAPEAPEVLPGLNLGPAAQIGGDFEYFQLRETRLTEGVVAGRVTHNLPVLSKEEALALKPVSLAERVGIWTLELVRTTVSLLLVGLLVVWLAPRGLQQAAQVLKSSPLPSLGWGFVSLFVFLFALLVVTMAVILLAFLTGIIRLNDLSITVVMLGGATFLGLLTAFSAAVMFVSKLVVSWLVGSWVLARVRPDWAAHRVWPMLAGVAMSALFMALPLIGGLIGFVVTLLGLGALWIYGNQRMGSMPPAPLEAAIRLGQERSEGGQA